MSAAQPAETGDWLGELESAVADPRRQTDGVSLLMAVSRDARRTVDQHRLAAALRRLLWRYPEDARLHLMLSRASWWRGDLEGAHGALEDAAARADPGDLRLECDVELLFHRARQRRISAEAAVAELRRIRSSALDAYVHIRADEVEVALLGQSPQPADVERSLRLSEDVVVDYLRLGHPMAAASCARSTVAAAHQHLGAYREGLALLGRAHPDLDLLPSDHRASFHGLVGRIAWLDDQWDRARSSADATLKEADAPTWVRGYARWTEMNLAGASGDREQVVSAYQAARTGLGAMMETSTGLVMLGEAAVAHAAAGLEDAATDLRAEAHRRRVENPLEHEVNEFRLALVHGADTSTMLATLTADVRLPWRRRDRLRASVVEVRPEPQVDASRLRLQVLGGFAAQRAGDVIDVPSGVVQRLIGLLVLDGPTTPDALVERLWPDDPVASRLKNVVYRARLALGADAIVNDGSNLRLAEHVTSDLAEFTEALARGPLDAAELAEIYPGPLLPHLDDLSLEFTRERTARRFAWAIRQALDAASVTPRQALVVSEDRKIVDEALLLAIGEEARAIGDQSTAVDVVALISELRTDLGLPAHVDLS